MKSDSPYLRLHKIVPILLSYFEIDHWVSMLSSVEVFDSILKLHSNITMIWLQGINVSINVSQKNSNSRDLKIYYLKFIEGQEGLSALFGTLIACINGSFFGYFDGLERSTF